MRVAMLMPLMGLDELPSKPLMRPATVTKRNPKTTTKTAAKRFWYQRVAAPSIGWNVRRVNRRIAGKLAIEFDGSHDDEPGDYAAREKNTRYARTYDVADAEIFSGDVGAKTSAGEPTGATFGLLGPGETRLHQERVD